MGSNPTLSAKKQCGVPHNNKSAGNNLADLFIGEVDMNNILYTIGYSGYTIDEFLNELKSNMINVLIDVRSSTYSKYYPDYNSSTLENFLSKHDIYYRTYSSEFGARQNNPSFYSSDGILDFEKFSKSEQFQSGVQKIRDSLNKNYKVALMCAEKNPTQCHRAILVSRKFADLGYEIIHLMPDGETKNQKQIENELLNTFFPDRNQLDLFSPPASDEENIIKAYKLQNKKIGYKMEET